MDSTDLAEDDISQFKRIRVVSKKNRIKHVPGPFSYQSTGEGSVMNPTQRQEADERKAWQELDALKASLGNSHPDTLLCFDSLARRLRNWGKYWTAEELLREALTSGEDMLLAHSPETLQLIFVGLMTVLVDQQKLDAAEELWQKSVETFRFRVGEDSANVLIGRFQTAHTFRRPSRAAVQEMTSFDEKKTNDSLSANLSVQQPSDLVGLLSSDLTLPLEQSESQLEPVDLRTLTQADPQVADGDLQIYEDQDIPDVIYTKMEVSDCPTSFWSSSPVRKTAGRYSLSDFEVQRTVGTENLSYYSKGLLSLENEESPFLSAAEEIQYKSSASAEPEGSYSPIRPRTTRDPVDRVQTVQTRQLAACVRCKMQRIRVSQIFIPF